MRGVAPAAVVWLVSLASVGCAPPDRPADEPPRLIAHAGGIGGHQTGTNSLEALDASVGRGHTAIEVDFSWTTDDHLVLLHDWGDTLTELFGCDPGPMTRAEFLSMASPQALTFLSLHDLAGWMERHPGILIVTDIKARNLEGLRLIADTYASIRHQFVPQVYLAESLAEVRGLGFERIIFSLYRSELQDSEIVEFVLADRPWAVTMPVRRAVNESLPEALAAGGVPVFAHTVNDYTTLDRLREKGGHGVYTDWLSPSDADHSEPPPEWAVSSSGAIPMTRWIAPFFPWGMEGLDTRMDLRSPAATVADVRVNIRGSNGHVVASSSVSIPGEGSLPIDLGAAVANRAGHGWVEVLASSDIEADFGWRFREQSTGSFVVTAATVDRFETRGSGSGLGGLLVAVVNPSDEIQTYRLQRSIAAQVIDDELIELRPERQMVRIYRAWTEEEIVVSASGGPMAVQTLAWDPLGRYLR